MISTITSILFLSFYLEYASNKLEHESILRLTNILVNYNISGHNIEIEKYKLMLEFNEFLKWVQINPEQERKTLKYKKC